MPRRLIVLDTEGYRERRELEEQHSFRCAVASFDTLNTNAEIEGTTQWLETECSGQLWSFIADYTTSKHRTVLFAHNLSYDLRLAGALRHLPALGFQCQQISLTSFSCWAQFRRNGAALWLVDSLAFIPVSVERIASAMGRDKLPLPGDDAPSGEWMERCRSDVEVTREGVLRILRYLKKEQLGDFRQTGAAQSSAAFRHRFLPERTLLVHDDREALDKERRAAWTGRAEVLRHGEYETVIHEWDYEYAYARIAFETEVPVKLLGSHSPLSWPRMENVMDHYAVLADVTIRTEIPCVPTERDGAIIWPVGEFKTTLWDSELRLAKREGAEIEVERYWYYQRQPALKEWARWILGELTKPTTHLDPVVRYMLKDWSRALIGRFGLRYSAIEEIARLPSYDLRLFGVYDADSKTSSEYLQVGGQLFERTAKIEAPNSTPAVMSSIMAASRVKLWEVLKIAGQEDVYYCDTDGVLVTARAADKLSRAVQANMLPGLRRKAAFAGGSFRSPRNIDLGETRRVNGAPRKAERLAPSIYRGEVWESLPTALKRRNATGVFLHERLFEVSDADRRRVHLDDGRTEPHRLSLDPPEILADIA